MLKKVKYNEVVVRTFDKGNKLVVSSMDRNRKKSIEDKII